MTTLNKIRAWSFAAFVGALALADWQVPKLVADGEEAAMPKAEVNGVKVTAAVKDIAAGDKVEKHWVMTLEGDGKGAMVVSCTQSRWDPLSRMMPRPQVVWERTIPFDTSVLRSIDLGPAPEADPKHSFDLVLGKVSADPGAMFMIVRLAHIAPLPPVKKTAAEELEAAMPVNDSTSAVTK